MTGFPTRPVRPDFGPDPVNRYPTRSPEHELDASIGKLMFHQMSGLGLTGPLAVLLLELDATPVILSREESWNPKKLTTGSYADPGITRQGAGKYTLNYLTQVPDENGDLKPLIFKGGWGTLVRRFSGGVPVVPDEDTQYSVSVWPTTNPPGSSVRIIIFDVTPDVQIDGTVLVGLW